MAAATIAMLGTTPAQLLFRRSCSGHMIVCRFAARTKLLALASGQRRPMRIRQPSRRQQQQRKQQRLEESGCSSWLYMLSQRPRRRRLHSDAAPAASAVAAETGAYFFGDPILEDPRWGLSIHQKGVQHTALHPSKEPLPAGDGCSEGQQHIIQVCVRAYRVCPLKSTFRAPLRTFERCAQMR